MAESHLRAFATFVGTTVGTRLGPCCENEELCANHLADLVSTRMELTLTLDESLALLRLNASALDPELKELLAAHRSVLFECIMLARLDRTINSRKG